MVWNGEWEEIWGALLLHKKKWNLRYSQVFLVPKNKPEEKLFKRGPLHFAVIRYGAFGQTIPCQGWKVSRWAKKVSRFRWITNYIPVSPTGPSFPRVCFVLLVWCKRCNFHIFHQHVGDYCLVFPSIEQSNPSFLYVGDYESYHFSRIHQGYNFIIIQKVHHGKNGDWPTFRKTNLNSLAYPSHSVDARISFGKMLDFDGFHRSFLFWGCP